MKSWIKGGLTGAVVMFLFLAYGWKIESLVGAFFDFLYVITYGPLGQSYGGDHFWYATIFLILISFFIGAGIVLVVGKINRLIG